MSSYCIIGPYFVMKMLNCKFNQYARHFLFATHPKAHNIKDYVSDQLKFPKKKNGFSKNQKKSSPNKKSHQITLKKLLTINGYFLVDISCILLIKSKYL